MSITNCPSTQLKLIHDWKKEKEKEKEKKKKTTYNDQKKLRTQINL